MKLSEIFRLVCINLSQNKFKVILTSIGIVVGAATIMLVIAIGTGGKMEVAEQFKNLNAGAIDITYEKSGKDSGKWNSDDSNSSGFSGFGGGFSGGSIPSGENFSGFGGNSSSGNRGSAGNSNSTDGGFSREDMPNMGGPSFDSDSGFNSDIFGGAIPDFMDGFITGNGFDADSRINQEDVTLTKEDMEDMEVFVPGLSDVTISYSTKSTIEGGELEEATSYTIGGVLSNYLSISNLNIAVGEFISDENEANKEKVAVLGSNVAKEIFGSALESYDETIYIDGRPYVVCAVLEEMGTVASGISPDDAVFIPYATGIKYLTGDDVNSIITVIAEDVDNVDTVIANIESVLLDTYPNTEFTITDAGTKMDAASASNETLTLLLYAMAAIVFIVGGIGIMNVLFVSVKERTNEIGILKALGCKQGNVLMEFLMEASCISFIGAVLGVLVSVGLSPVIEQFGVRVELSLVGGGISLLFGVLTGTIFGFYPAFKASRLVPVVALNQE